MKNPRPFALDPDEAKLVEERPPRGIADDGLDAAPAPASEAPSPPRWRLGWWWFWAGISVFLGLALLADAISGIFTWLNTAPLFGLAMATLLVGTLAVGVAMLIREIAAVRKLGSVGDQRAEIERLLPSELHGESDTFIESVSKRCADRPGALARFEAHDSDTLSDGERLKLFERTVVANMDEAAYKAVVRGSRDIGVLTALSPLGLLDAGLVLWRTMTMLRAIAKAYGLPVGALASAVLLKRAVRNMLLAGLADLVTHGAADIMGAGFLRMLSARAGQGAANAMLSARLGCEAMQLVRPMPFTVAKKPNLKLLAGRILSSSG